MAYKIDFINYQQLVNFINYVEDLWLWNCTIFRMSNSIGNTLNLDTVDTSNVNMSYVQFSKLIDYMNKYYENNNPPVTMDIKLICPDYLRLQADPNRYYQAFYVNFFSNGKINYVTLSYNENGSKAESAPFTVFVGYIMELYNKWKAYYSNEYEA